MNSRASISRSLLLLTCVGLVILPGAAAGEKPSGLEEWLARIFFDGFESGDTTAWSSTQ